MVEEHFVLFLFPRRRRARSKAVRIGAIGNEVVFVIHGHQFLFSWPLGSEEHAATCTFVNAQIVLLPDGARRVGIADLASHRLRKSEVLIIVVAVYKSEQGTS